MSRGTRRAFLVPLIGLLLLCGWVYLTLDPAQAEELSRHANWWLVGGASGFSLLSYVFICFALLRIGRTMGLRKVSSGIFLIVTFMSLTVNHVVSLGVAGYSARVLLLRRAGEAPGTVLAASLLHSYLTSLVMVALLPVGLLAITLYASVPPAGIAALQAATAVSSVTVVLMTVALFSRPLRLWVLGAVDRLGRRVAGRTIEALERALIDVDMGLAAATRAARQRPTAALAPFVLTLLDWAAVLLAYWLCLHAVGAAVGPWVLIAGFAIGMNVGVVSLVPGGIGVQEGSQAGVLALFGVPFGTALLASVLFRFVYFLLPFFLSLPFYSVVLRRVGPVEGEPEPPPPGAS